MPFREGMSGFDHLNIHTLKMASAANLSDLAVTADLQSRC